MLTLDDYLDLAKKRLALPSDRQLSFRLGLDAAIVSQMRRRHMFPADATMIRLAELAGLDPDESLLVLAQWRATTPEVKEHWERIYRKVTATAASALVVFGLSGLALPDSAASAEVHNRTLYIMENTSVAETCGFRRSWRSHSSIRPSLCHLTGLFFWLGGCA